MNSTEKHEAEKKLKKAHHFNVLDAIIVVLVLACVVGIIIRYNLIDGLLKEANLSEYEITFSVADVRYTTANAFVEGDTFYIDDKDIFMGYFEKLDSISPAVMYVNDAEGNVMVVNYPESTRIDLTGRISCEGRFENNRFLLNGTYYIAPGKTLDVRSEHLDIQITVSKITAK